MNELLDWCQPLLLTNESVRPESSLDNRSLRRSQPQKRSAGVLAGTEFVARIKVLGEARGEQTQFGLTLVDRHLFLDRSNA